MHTAHIVLVKAENHQDAIDRVRTALESDEGRFAEWSDWAIVGDEGFGGSRFSFRHDNENWDGASDYAVSRDDEADLFYKVLEQFTQFRQNAFYRLHSALQDENFAVYVDQDDMVSYKLHKLAELADSRYCYESAVYDLENYSANLRYFQEDEAKGGEGWFAVLVDFHF